MAVEPLLQQVNPAFGGARGEDLDGGPVPTLEALNLPVYYARSRASYPAIVAGASLGTTVLPH